MTNSKFRFTDVIKYFSLIIGVFVVLFPPYVVIVNAFKSTDEFNSSSSMALPKSFLISIISLQCSSVEVYLTDLVTY